MLPYTKFYFEELLNKQSIQNVQPSSEWYEERLDYSKESLGTSLKKHINHGFELIRGTSEFEGKILGGCLESIFDIFDNSRYEDTISLCDKYELFPSLEEWKGKILLLETSEEKPTPDIFREMIKKLEEFGLFDVWGDNDKIAPLDRGKCFITEYKFPLPFNDVKKFCKWMAMEYTRPICVIVGQSERK